MCPPDPPTPTPSHAPTHAHTHTRTTTHAHAHMCRLHRNVGYQPDMQALKLEGHSVVELALQAARMPVTLEEVQAHLREADPEAYKVLVHTCEY